MLYYISIISRELEKQLIICESEKITLQNQLLDMQTTVINKCVSNKEKQNSLKVQDCDPKVKSNEIMNDCEVDTPKLKKNDSCIIIDVSKCNLFTVIYLITLMHFILFLKLIFIAG